MQNLMLLQIQQVANRNEVDRPAVIEAVNQNLISSWVKPKTMKIGIHTNE